MKTGIQVVDAHVDHCENSSFHSVRWEAIRDFWAEKWKDLTYDFQDGSGCGKPVDAPEKKQEG